MPVPSPEQLIAAGPSTDQTPPPDNVSSKPSLEPQSVENVKVTSAEPTKLNTESVDDNGDATDPRNKFKSIVGKEKPAPATEPTTDSTVEPTKTQDNEPDLPVTAKLRKTISPRDPLEEQLKGEDLSDFDDEGLKFAKQMSKPAREWAKARVKEAKELREKLNTAPAGMPQNWYEHENAYVLLPEFQQNVEKVNLVNEEYEHWKQQLINIKKGDSWVDLVRKQDGTIEHVRREPTVEAEEAVSEWKSNASRIIQETSGRINGIKHAFQQERGKVNGAVKAIEDTFFPQYKDPKALENDKEVAKVQQLFQKFNQHNTPTAGFTYKLYKWSMDLFKENEDLRSQVSGQKEIKKERQLAGPSSGELSEGGGKTLVGDDKPFDISEFERIKRR